MAMNRLICWNNVLGHPLITMANARALYTKHSLVRRTYNKYGVLPVVSIYDHLNIKMIQAQSPTLLRTHNWTGSASIPLDNLPSPGDAQSQTTNAPKSYVWKTHGYQDFSRWMASEDDFFVFRRFGSLNAGTILWMQYRISALEQKLEQLHQRIAESDPSQEWMNSSFEWDEVMYPERTSIMAELSGLLLQYSKCVVYS
jgi:hypothetical protein